MSTVQRIEIDGQTFVLLRESDYEELRREAGRSESGENLLPPLPGPDKDGLYPGIEYARASMARRLIRQRTELGLSREALAKLAGVRAETLARAEDGKRSVSTSTIDKLFDALETAERRQTRRRRRS